MIEKEKRERGRGERKKKKRKRERERAREREMGESQTERERVFVHMLQHAHARSLCFLLTEQRTGKREHRQWEFTMKHKLLLSRMRNECSSVSSPNVFPYTRN